MAHCPQAQIRPTDYMVEQTTILIVDDEAGPRESLRMILSPAHKVIPCSSGREALEILRTTSVDLVTIDLNMPMMKGDELMRAIRREFPAVEIIIITGCGTVGTAIDGLRHGICDYISKPFDVVEVSSAVSRALTRKRNRRRLVEFLEGVGTIVGKDRDSKEILEDLRTNPELQNKLTTVLHSSRAATEGSPIDDESDSTSEFLDVLGQTLGASGDHLRDHAQRVGFYASMLGERLGLSREQMEQIRIASFLHDLGRVGLSGSTDIEAQQRAVPDGQRDEEHPKVGAELVKPLGFSKGIEDAIRHHHEQWNGEGFPDQLAGPAIPLAARIIAIVDSFDAMISDRPSRPRLAPEEALHEMKKIGGTVFDPALLDEFVSMIESGDCDPAAASAIEESHPNAGDVL